MPPAVLFDFRDPLPVPEGAARLVAGVAESVPRVGLLVGAAAGRSVPASCAGVRRAAVVELASPGAVWAPLACGLPDPGLLVVPAASAVALADLLMGGAGAVEERRSTPLEQGLLVRHLVPALRPVSESLAESGVTPLAAGPVTDEPLPVGAAEVLAVGIDLALPSGTSARVTLCLPAKSLLPAEPETGPAPAVDARAHVLGEVPVDVALRLPPTVVTAADVDDLAPGDVIRLDPAAVQSLLGVLETGTSTGPGTLPVLTASLGRRGRHRAVVVHALLAEPDAALPPGTTTAPLLDPEVDR